MSVIGYTSPGVSVFETITPSMAPLLSNPSVIALVGFASGAQSATERLILNVDNSGAPVPVNLKFTGVDQDSVVVLSTANNAAFNVGAYIVAEGDDPNPSITGDEPSSIALNPAPTTAPNVSNAGTGTLAGTYVYAVSFVNAAGETGIGPASSPTVFSTQGANLSAIPVDTNVGDTGTTARNVYRAKVISGVTQGFNLVATIANNVGTTLASETTDDGTAAAAASPKALIAPGDTVIISYTYTNQNYFLPTTLDDYGSIADKYGAPFDANGNIASPLSFAARLAFQNGASEIVCVASTADTDDAIGSAIQLLANEPEVRIIAVVSGSADVHASLDAHLTSMNSVGQYRQGIVGRDGSASTIDAATLRLAAKAFNDEALIMVSPASFVMQNPVTGRNMTVGSQYAAAAVAGMFAARDVQIPLTRKTLAGFVDLADSRTSSEQAIDSQSGLFVVVNKGGVLQIRHQVTTAPSNVNTAEASVIRSKYEMAHRLADTLDGSVVGNVLPVSETPLIVGNVVTSVLEQLVVEGAIQSYANVAARILDTDATTVEVRFEYYPSFPINNVVVNFTINTVTGSTDLSTS